MMSLPLSRSNSIGSNRDNNIISNGSSVGLPSPNKTEKVLSMYGKIHALTAMRHALAKPDSPAVKKSVIAGASSLPPPKCLEEVVRKIQASDVDNNMSEDRKKYLNDKLMCSLFLAKIDSEEVASAIQNVEYEDLKNDSSHIKIEGNIYEAKSAARFDQKLGAFVYSTSVIIRENEDTSVKTTAQRKKTSTTCYSEMNSYPYKVPKKAVRLKPLPNAPKAPSHHHHHHHHQRMHDVDPLGTKHMAEDIEHSHKAMELYRKNHNVISTLDGNLFPICDADAKKYFGDEAKNLFFDQYRKINDAKYIIATQSSVTTLLSRPATRDTDYTSYSYDSDDSGTNRFSQRDQTEYDVATPRGGETSMSKLGDDYYYELQAQVSKDHIHREIDHEILTYDSFAKVYQKKMQPRPRSDSVVSTATASSNINSSRRYSPPRLASSLERDSTLSYDRFESSLMTVDVPVSPRTKYLSGCLRESIVPLPNLILRKTMCSVLNFAHLGMGDKMGRVLAGCIQDLPLIESINFADNNLTDDSLAPLIEAIIHIKTLKELDLSRNKVDGQSSDSLAEFVSRGDCPIIKLTMQNADVDDGECDRFVQMLVTNKQLLELDMSHNLLGTAETLEPGTKTGAESIAEYICSKECRLKVLKLAWNSIRMTSAVKLAKALAINNTLTYLDLSCNGLGWAAGEQIGDSIMENRMLKTLMISGNNLTSTACVSICIGIVENLALHVINMNENPIGAAGAKMIMQISMAVGNRMTLSAANCNTIATDERCWYHPDKVCTDYVLNLSKPFDRAVAFHLCQVVAAHSTFIFTNVSYEEVPGRRAAPMKLINAISTDRELYMDDDQKAVLKGLRLLLAAASNVELGTKLFYEADADMSGRLDKDELKEVLDKIGFTLDEDQLSDILAVFDIDGAGTIDLQEFLSLLKSQHREATHRIKDLIEYPIMAVSTSPKQKYIPPRKGILYCSVVDGFTRKAHFYTMSSLDQKYAYKMAQGIGDVAMVNEAIQNTKIRYNEALQLYKTMFNDSGDKIGTLAKIVPLMMLPNEARQLVSKITKDNRVELARIKMVFGVTHRPVFGAYNGYYYLDLSKELHRQCLSKLLEQSQTSNAKRGRESIIAPFRVGDTSQHGNWSAFRNEFYNGRPVCITTAMFTPVPFSGILEFDFSGGIRATGGELRITDKRLCKVLQNICMLTPDNNDEALEQLDVWKAKAREMTNAKNLYMPIFQNTLRHAVAIGVAKDGFNEHLNERQALIKAGSKQEDIHVNYMGAEGAAEFAEELTEQADSLLEMAKEIKEEAEANSGSDDSDDDEERNFDGTKAYDQDENLDDVSASTATEESSTFELTADEELNRRKLRIKELKHRMHLLKHAKHGVSMHAKAFRFSEVIDETFNSLWILSRHLALIVKIFLEEFGNVSRTEYFGSYVTDIIVCLFSRVVDVHNFETVLSVLDPVDTAAVYLRLGFLNIFNPMKPEVTMELSMNSYEERMVAKMIVYLSVVEPGINLTYKQFQWKRDMDPIPGWDVTEPWMTEEGLAKNGLFLFTYYSGEGKNKMGCIPDVRLRKALTTLVLVDENEIVDEDDMVPDEKVITAADHYAQNKDTWINYLVVGCDQFKNLRF